MTDLWIAVVVMLVLSLVAGLITAALASEKHPQRQKLIVAIAAFGMFAFLFYAAGRLYWARFIPDSAVIIWSNFTPILAAVTAGCCWRLANTPRWRRLLMSSALSFSSVAAVLWPFLGIALRPPPPGGNVWKNGVAMQTAWATCSPAAAATFLYHGGINVNEAEMVPRCLTDSSGTPTLGLYRGVKLTSAEHGRDVTAGQLTIDELLRSDNWPVLLMVKLPVSGVDDPRYADEWGWIPGLGHSVVALGTDAGGGIVIGDPAKGIETWSETDLRVLWHGDAIRFTNKTANVSEQTGR